MTIKNKRILITGGAGFIGSSLSRQLNKHNDVLIFDNYRRNALKYFNDQNKIKIIKGDIMDLALLKGTMQLFKPQIILHLAAMAGVTDYYRKPTRTMEVNAVGTYNVLKSTENIKLDHFIYFSTSEVYGPLVFGAKENGNTAQGDLKQIRWTYGISKLTGEGLSFAFSQEKGFPVTSVRPFNIYGPGQVGEGAIQIFIRKALKNQTIKVTGDGNQIRAWCYIDDMTKAILATLGKSAAKGEIFNIGNPDGTITILSLAKLIISQSKSKSKIEFVPHQGVDIDLRVPNIQKAKNILNFKPTVDLEKGISQSIQWYKKTPLTEPIT